jgi:hypothetical protein
MLFFNTIYPASGNTASLGIGGKTVSTSDAKNTPTYRLSDINESIH